MCVYPRYIVNPHYKPNKSNGGFVPIPMDERLRYIPVGCGECYECRKIKKKQWMLRLMDELKNKPKDKKIEFVTLTFSEEKLSEAYKYVSDSDSDKIDLNAVAAKQIELFRERWRKRYGQSCKHYLIPEKGHTGTERLHLHGFIWCDWKTTKADIEKVWGNGWIYKGKYVNEKTINYVTKYILKTDKRFAGRIFASKGLGSQIYERSKEACRFKGKDTHEKFRNYDGKEYNLPMYIRNKIYSQPERERLYIQKLNKEQRWLDGILYHIGTDDGLKQFEQALTIAQEKNLKLGHNEPKAWKESKQKNTLNLNKIKGDLNNWEKSHNFVKNYKTNENYKSKTSIWPNERNLAERKNHKPTLQGMDRYNSCRQNILTTRKRRLCNAELGKRKNPDLETYKYQTSDNYNLNIYEKSIQMEEMVAGLEKRTENNGNRPTNNTENHGFINENAIRTRQNDRSHGEDLRHRYEIIDIETGEIYNNTDTLILKTISYERKKEFELKPDGTKRTVWRTKRFVTCQGRQTSLF